MSASTIKQRGEFADRLLDQWGTFDLPPHEVAEWLRQYHGWTYNTYRNHLRSIYTWLAETHQLEQSPIARVRRAPNPPPKPAPLSLVEIDRLLSTAGGHLRTWLLLGYLAGLRCHEITKVRGEDITEQTLYVHGKGGRIAYLPTHPTLWEVAQTYPRTGFWFPSTQAKREYVSEGQVSTKIRAHFRAHGITDGAVHRLRHSYGTSLARGGAQMRVVQELMRHSSLDTTMRYVGVDEDEKRAALALLVA